MPMIELSLTSLCPHVRMAEWSKAPDSRHYLLLSCWGFWSPHGDVGSNPTSDKGYFIIGSVFETLNIIVSIIYFAIWPMPMIELSLISLCQQFRMAEWSKAPDSRHYLLLSCWGFWSPHGGVGSNPTSDKGYFIIGSVFETLNIIVSIIYFAIWPMPMIELSLISLCQQVRMAERSKAPGSRHCQLLDCWGFWSPHGGVGSNPTSDTSSFWIGSNVETVNLIVFIPSFAFWPITFIELFQIPLLTKALL